MEPLDWDLTFQRFAYETGTRFHPAREHPQMPTPPIENDHGPPVHDDPPTEVVVLVKSGSNANLNRDAPDLLLLSSDSVRFYVHSAILLAASDNGFQSLILTSAQRTAPKLPDPDAAILVPESSVILHMILRIVYGLSCSPYVPPLDLLSDVVNRLSLYGLQAHSLIRPGTPFYALLFSHTPFAPMNVYILAASNKLHQLAVTASSHLVSFPLSAITDAMAEAMGSMYLQKLFFLQLERSAALKKLLLEPPKLHLASVSCDATSQQRLTRAWALASAYLAWEARPDLSAGFIESSFISIADDLSCQLCKQSLTDCIRTVVTKWAKAKCTI